MRTRLPKHIIEEHQESVKNTRVFGVPLTELDRDSLLTAVVIGVKAQERAFERFQEYAAMMNTMRTEKV